MKFQNVVIHQYAYVDPERFISSSEIEEELKPVYERLKLPEGRLELQTGIKTRGVWKPGTKPSSIATSAAEEALKNFDRSKIDLLIHASVCRDFLEPATASVVHSNLKLSTHCQFFDLSNACLGVVTAMNMASQLIESRAIKNCLIVSGENSGPLLFNTIRNLNSNTSLSRQDIKPYFANFTIGSSGVALLLSHQESSDSALSFLGSHTLTDSAANKLCQGSGDIDNLVMETNSEELLKAGIKLAFDTFNETLQKFEFRRNEIKTFIPHQVGVQHRAQMMKALEIDETKVESTFEIYGNTGSAALPLTFMKSLEKNIYHNNDLLTLLGIGSGLASTVGFVRYRK